MASNPREYSGCWLSVLVNRITQVCNPPADFTYQASGSQNTVHGIELAIDHDPGVTVYLYRGSNDATVLFNELNVNLKASVTSAPGGNAKTREIRLTGTGRVLGTGRLKILNKNYYTLLTPQLFLRLNSTTSSVVPFEVQNQFLSFVQACVTPRACNDVRSIKSDGIKFNLHLDQLSPHVKDSNRVYELNSVEGEDVLPCICTSHQQEFSNNNVVVDALLLEFSKYLASRNLYSIPLPDIDASFKTGKGIFTVNGRFQTRNGRFEDLTTLVRKADSLVVFDNMRYTIIATVGLSTSKLFYDSYTFKYGFLKVGGEIWGEIDGMMIELVLTIDYSTDPCTGKTIFINVSKPGKLKINISGLGILNKWVSQLITYVSSAWNVQIIPVIKSNVVDLIEKAIGALNCAKYEKTLSMLV